MAQEEAQQGAAVVNNNNNIPNNVIEDERMDNEEYSIDSLYVNKHANHEATTTHTGDGRNQVRSMRNSLKRDLETSGANDKVLDAIEEKAEDKVEMGYTHEG
eukprot:106446_1